MNTPICDFVRQYSLNKNTRLHMPGHKGCGTLGIESLDITEINGADSLYEANGIIAESENNASRIFGCKTFYSTEGSSQCIRAMLYLVALYAKSQGEKPLILAGRNAHKAFINAAAVIDFDVEWIFPEKDESYMSCRISAEKLEKEITSLNCKPTAVYITNPDYLGNSIDIKSLSGVCKRHKILLIVDNAHGAYLKFLNNSQHPIDLGADLCCDSAHKTLPVLTGGAYLHISNTVSDFFADKSKDALALFGSTSPSYLILQSLDAANKYINDGYKESLQNCIVDIHNLKNELFKYGYNFVGNEPLKLTIETKKYGYFGYEFADILESNKIFCEFSDPDYVVLMFTPETCLQSIKVLKKVMLSIKRKPEINIFPPKFYVPKKIFSIREAVFSESETIQVNQSLGKILSVSDSVCPPAVPILISGERISENSLKCFDYYGITHCKVIKQH